MSSDILGLVTRARECARISMYEDALKYYSRAKVDADMRLSRSKGREEISKWKEVLGKIQEEQDSVGNVVSARTAVLGSLSQPHRILVEEDEKDIPAIHGRYIAPDRRPEVPGRAVKSVGLRGPGAAPRVGKVSAAPAPARKASNGPAGRAVGPVAKKGQQDKPAVNMESPLVQQIIEMGILVREPSVHWDSIAGLANVKRELRQNLVILPMRPDIAKGLLSPWKSVLFYGPPGTGKTFIAKAVATECKRTFFNVTSATITSRFHGESEKLVGNLFGLADQMAPSTIFFDEIDSIASQRGGSHENEASRRMKSQLLTKMEGIDATVDGASVFVMAATNFPWDLDEALLRRFHKRIYIPLPDKEGRMSILKMSMDDSVADEFDWDSWADKLDGYSCADITNLCRDSVQAVFTRDMDLLSTQQFVNLPAEQVKPHVTNADFEVAVRKRKSSVDQATLKRYEEWRDAKGAE